MMICDQCDNDNDVVKKFDDINLCESCAYELGMPWSSGIVIEGGDDDASGSEGASKEGD